LTFNFEDWRGVSLFGLRELAVSHTLIGIDEARKREFSGRPELH
jgi:hypothetical protein